MALAGLPALPSDDDEPTPQEVQAVLRELGLAPARAPAKPASSVAPPAAVATHRDALPARRGIEGTVGERMEAFHRAADAAFARGDADDGNRWLRKGVELSQAVALVLQRFPPPDTPHGASGEGAAPAGPAKSAAAAVVPLVSSQEIEAMVSARVVQSVVDQLAGSDSELLLALLERKAQIEALVEEKGVDCDVLQAAIQSEKAMAAHFKAAGNTGAALRALKRAKIMMDEIREINDASTSKT
ncbi:hypothetical protein AB1Y20_004584 [Prymnesium parvum]|uniref:Uncharacterized protein n=1 Tax=Prymnesium parvum TaxID=97485 RepID=A0AB34IYV2_PRYPA